MTGKKPPSWFEEQERKDEASEKVRRERLLKELPELMARREGRGRARRFEPYLLVRSVLGDRGDRPINVPFWESPDIWTAPGDPSTSPQVPANHGGNAVVGQANTLYAHVWNLGFAPLAGIRVEFYWFNPSLAIDGNHAHLIGTAVCELSSRAMPGSHALVKCPKPWVPVMENGGHECLMVRIAGLGDPIGGNEWSPWLNRHVAQRNITVISASEPADKLVNILNRTLMATSRVELIQVGAKEGELARRIAAPAFRIAPQLRTHVLGELTVAGEVRIRERAQASAGALAPIHARAHGLEQAPPIARRHNEVPAARPRVLLKSRGSRGGTGDTRHLANLLGEVANHDHQALEQPAPGEAYVLRLATYDKEQLIGGYTLVTAGAER
jgi:hypothetical protein